MPWKRVVDLTWPVEKSEGIFNAAQAMHENLTNATGGQSLPDPLWRLLKSPLTLHPLGGCVMGAPSAAGAVGHLGRTFVHLNLIVADGAILPTPTVRGPSRTIAAPAARIAAHVA
ncbi:GMC oxidoreductase [Sorangium sp. So ce291]|uniref:GMC oxidoreductase n=1 Tax=Sorangium sp. So ce291 TaxID=3133294 RepID=UPI003F648150